METGACQLKLFGTIRLCASDSSELPLPSRKARLLLVFLALHPNQDVSRERLIDLFWPEMDEESGRDNLSTTLARLRKTLSLAGIDNALVANRQFVSLRSTRIYCDIAAFESALREYDAAHCDEQKITALEKAVSLYAGEPLPGVYGDWAIEIQDRLIASYHSVLHSLLKLHMTRADYPAAVYISTLATSHDPLDEISVRARMRALAALGRINELEDCFNALGRALLVDARVSPSQQTRELYERLKAQYSEEELSIANSVAPYLSTAPNVEPRWSLPDPRTSFFGRTAEIERIYQVLTLPTCFGRLVTLTGIGGIGKTRTAIEYAARFQECYPEGVFYIPVADVVDTNLLLSTIVRALVPNQNTPTAERIKSIASSCRTGTRLLILDNFEQLVVAGSSVIAELLAQCSGLKILITSRLRLGIEAETEVNLEPLLAATSAGKVTGDDGASDAVSIFIDRSGLTRSEYSDSGVRSAVIRRLCTQLEGIPLALELAASCTALLTPEQILDNLSCRFDLLVNRNRDVLPRHRTLSVAIGASYTMLTYEQQALFRELSVFRGGVAIPELISCWNQCKESPYASFDQTQLLESLAVLRAHSLVECERAVSGASVRMRYRMLETVREYAVSVSPEVERQDRDLRHAHCFAGVLRSLRSESEQSGVLAPGELGRRLESLDIDIDNLRYAFKHLQGSEYNEAMAAQFALDFDWFLMVRDYQEERREVAIAAYERFQHSALPVGLIDLLGIGRMHHAPMEVKRAWYCSQVALIRESDNQNRLAGILGLYGDVAVDERSKTASFAESMDIYTKLGCLDAANVSRASLAGVYTQFGRLGRATALLKECLEYNLSSGRDWDAARIRFALGQIALRKGRTCDAISRFELALDFFRTANIRRLESSLRGWLAAAHCLSGHHDLAQAYADEELQSIESLGGQIRPGDGTEMYCYALIHMRRLEEATRVLTGLSMSVHFTSMGVSQQKFNLAMARGEDAAAKHQLCEWAECLQSDDGDAWGAVWHNANANLAGRLGDLKTAASSLRACLAAAVANELLPLIITSLATAADIAVQTRKIPFAIKMLDVRETLMGFYGFCPIWYEQAGCELLRRRCFETEPSVLNSECSFSSYVTPTIDGATNEILLFLETLL